MDIIFFGNMTQFDKNVSTFSKNMLPPSSGLTFQNSYFHIREETSNVSANLKEKGPNTCQHKSLDLSKKPNDPM
jgi:hypothetical protein